MNAWTEEMDAILKRARADGLSFAAIPGMMIHIAKVSRSSCIGRAKRLGLCVAADRIAQARGLASVQRRVINRAATSRPLPPLILETTEFARPWIERRPDQCAWPIEIGDRPADWWSCCAPTPDGDRYCDAHQRRMWRKFEDEPVAAPANQSRTAA